MKHIKEFTINEDVDDEIIDNEISIKDPDFDYEDD